MTDKKRVRIADIAEAAGVSTATVSRVINEKDGDIRISDETRNRVLEAIDRLGYERNLFSFALRAEKTGIIGAVNRNPSGLFMSNLAHEILREAHERDVEILMAATYSEETSAKAQISMLQGQLFDGFLLLGDMPNYHKMIEQLRKLDKPYVSVFGGTSALPPLVHVDERKGMKLALDHLTELGHHKIAFMGSPSWVGIGERLEAFEKYLHRKGIPLPSSYMCTMGDLAYAPESGQSFTKPSEHLLGAKHAQELMQLPDPPTAIFCATDGFAMQAIYGLSMLGISVPHDVSVVGYDGVPMTAYYNPPVTTVQTPIDQIAAEAIRLLLELIDSPDTANMNNRVILEPKLIVRKSTARPDC
jgi:DNA-binding LacI/PurR family transcriptional regulator